MCECSFLPVCYSRKGMQLFLFRFRFFPVFEKINVKKSTTLYRHTHTQLCTSWHLHFIVISLRSICMCVSINSLPSPRYETWFDRPIFIIHIIHNNFQRAKAITHLEFRFILLRNIFRVFNFIVVLYEETKQKANKINLYCLPMQTQFAHSTATAFCHVQMEIGAQMPSKIANK